MWGAGEGGGGGGDHPPMTILPRVGSSGGILYRQVWRPSL